MLVTSDWMRTRPEPDCTTNEVCPGVWPGVSIAVTPGRTSWPHSYFVTRSASPEHFASIGEVALHHIAGGLRHVVVVHPERPFGCRDLDLRLRKGERAV